MTNPTAPVMVGIDPGVNTGFAVWNRNLKALERVESLQIHEAMDEVRRLHGAGLLHSVVFEDARLRTWFGERDAKQEKYGAGVREGSGSVKRDCAIWAGFLGSLGIAYSAVKPGKGTTKWTADGFKRLTGWTARTNEHGRDAACLVFGRS